MDERRYYGLDALRGAMMMMGIVLHGAIFYLDAPPPILRAFVERDTSPVMDALVHLIHSFRMPLFFLLSGFFTALLVERRGVWGTLRNRGARVAAPLLAAAFTILPLTMLFMVDYMLAAHKGVFVFVPERAQAQELRELIAATGLPVDRPGLAHLWFLYYLCWFYLLIPLCRVLARASGERVRAFLASPASIVALGLYTAVTLWPFPGGQVYGKFVFIEPYLPALLYYGSFFVFGYVAHARRECLAAQAGFLPWTIALAALLFPLSMWLSHAVLTGGPGALPLHAAAIVANGVCTWALISALLGVALRHFDRESPWTLYVSQSSYWVYLLHMPLVLLAAWLLVPAPLPALAKFALVVSFATAGCLATYHYGVRRTWIGAFLHGRRFDTDWPWRRPAAQPA